MTIVKQLVKFTIYPVAMGAGVALCLWILLGPLRIDRLVLAGQATLATPEPPLPPASQPAGVSEPVASAAADPHPIPDDRLARPGRIASAMEDLPLGPGDSGPLVMRLQDAL